MYPVGHPQCADFKSTPLVIHVCVLPCLRGVYKYSRVIKTSECTYVIDNYADLSTQKCITKNVLCLLDAQISSES
jgi:hypothetical protein